MVTWAIKPNSLCVVEVVAFSLAELVVSVGRRAVSSSLTQVISPGDCDADEAADGNVDCCVVDGWTWIENNFGCVKTHLW